MDIRVGQSITKEISLALSRTDIFCFIISSNSAQSGWVDREFSSILPIIISGSAYLIPCRIDDTKVPTIIGDIKYADFRKDFTIGLNQLFNGVKIKEEIELQDTIQATKSKLLEKLNKGEVAYFAYYFSKRNRFFIGDNRTQLAPYDLLRKLTDIGILEVDADRHEFLYEITEIGRGVHSEIMKIADKTLFDKFQEDGIEKHG